ncbi:MAG: hypothetical protein RLZZ435_880 [Cyanobacteriota bacterium]
MNVTSTLAEIDQQLITLLSQRIQLLAASDRPQVLGEFVPDPEQLDQAGIPPSVWTTLMTGCLAAALRHRQPVATASQSRRITLLGGGGMMGKFFKARFEAAGHHVTVFEATDWSRAEALVADADLVLLCVPLKATVAIVEQLAPYLSPHTLLADIASVKGPVCQAMLKAHAGPVVGLHPMFGPGATALLGQKIILCPGRGERTYQWLLDWFKAEGVHLITCSPEEHDRMMVMIQAIRHFSTFCLGVFLAEEGIHIDRSLEFSTLIYRIEAAMIGRLFAQDSELYIEIMLASADRLAAIQRLAQTYQRLADFVNQNDRSALTAAFANARHAFHPETGWAMKESNYLIQNLSHFLAANLAEQANCSPGNDLEPRFGDNSG